MNPGHRRRLPPVDLTTRVGDVVLANPVMTASGTAGHGTELADYIDLGSLGAFVVKSLAAEAWPGNPPLRVHPAGSGMINSIGLQGPGLEAWAADVLPSVLATGATVVVSIWGRSIADYRKAAEIVGSLPPGVVACEVNVSCPNVEARNEMFAHSAGATQDVIAATRAAARPIWAKLSPNVTDIVAIAAAARAAGAAAVTLVNTVMGMVIDVDTRRPVLGAGGGGLSGPPIHPVAVRAVFDVRAALGDVPIVGVGGVASAVDAIELMMAGASAVQVGTATFADPRAPAKVLTDLRRWCRANGVRNVSEVIGAAHR